MSSPILSILLPVYNSEKYIERCIRSILEIKKIELEIVVVNDGSTDDTGVILESIAHVEQRLKLFTQENKGISYTRNVCLKNSTGEYIAFVDSDDWIDAHQFEFVFEKIITNNIDIAISSFFFHEGKTTKTLGKIKSVKHAKQSYIDSEWGTLWRLIIKKAIIDTNHLSFPDGIDGGEDYYFANMVLMNTECILTNNKAYYHYDYGNGISFTHELSKQKIYYQIEATKLLEAAFLKSNKEWSAKNLLLKRKFLAKKDLLLLDVNEWKNVFPECNSFGYKCLTYKEYIPFLLLLHKLGRLYKLYRKIV